MKLSNEIIDAILDTCGHFPTGYKFTVKDIVFSAHRCGLDLWNVPRSEIGRIAGMRCDTIRGSRGNLRVRRY